MCAALSSAVDTALTSLGSYMATLLDGLVERYQIGVMQWFSPNICTYNFFQNSYDRTETNTVTHRNHVQIGRRHTQLDTILREVCVVHHYARHEHDLVDARYNTIEQMRKQIPTRLQTVIDLIPPALLPFFQIISGRQVYEGVFDTIAVARSLHQREEIKEWIEPDPVEQAVSRPDPALVIGNYCLAAWTAGEK